MKRRQRQSINHLPEELIEEILLSNLPVKSLFRFKSVSKSWRSLISSPKFVQDHLNRTNQALIATFYNKQLTLRSCSINSLIDDPNENDVVSTRDHHYPTTRNTDCSGAIRILGSCNGLILIKINNTQGNRLLLWNPSTRHLKTIPPPPSSHSPSRLMHFRYGLGYDDSTHDYKVVLGMSHSEPGRPKTDQTEIYSARTDSWKKIDSFEKSFVICSCTGKSVNGKLHWVGMEEGLWKITSLGLEEGKEKYQVMALPDYFSSGDQSITKLENLGGYLSLICHDSVSDIIVWVMMEYGSVESWTKVWTFSDHDRRLLMPSITYNDSAAPFWVTKNGDIFVFFGKSKVLVFNGEKKLREYQIGKDGESQDHCTHTVYVESLVSP